MINNKDNKHQHITRLTEEELIKGCINNNTHCQKLLFDRYSGKMMSLCLRYSNDEQEAQDILQEGFIKIFAYLHQFRSEGSLEGWMRRVFVSIATRHLSKRKIKFTDIESVPENINSNLPIVVSKLSEDEIHKLIRSLPDGYRTVFNMNVIEGYSHDEIGKMLGIQATTSRTQLLKARKMLQQLIIKQYNSIEI
ncbi:RNA polymerase sigma factor [Ferruginibacter albus]|uniref:RNA polymerase sigma factor n=1 Tax=Ferruginibacter albus TaxID=2875540 RepID=UPI001CC70184|nr:sigma-70 family RNA polymerase sigma factor [Ferruginibacter albus]UAY51446.1 sigma-70 family RNA polymerase sigma factor [Ferruginibacter albus]